MSGLIGAYGMDMNDVFPNGVNLFSCVWMFSGRIGVFSGLSNGTLKMLLVRVKLHELRDSKSF